MRIFCTFYLLVGLFPFFGQAQELNRNIEEYIRKNNVVTVSASDTTYYKKGKPYLKNYGDGIKTLTVPKGAIAVPMPKGLNDINCKFYSPFVSSNLEFTLYIVQLVDGKEKMTAIKGGDIRQGDRTRVDLLVDWSNYQKTVIYSYFLSGCVFSAPYLIGEKNVAKFVNFKMSGEILGQNIPAILIYDEGSKETMNCTPEVGRIILIQLSSFVFDIELD
ncbi:hypothetical protein [Bacteroides sp.]|uniref:hypothetical protein n=1 Tax=Bacteroides sp. TaxID=29523 RepID=UPI00262B180E|nr:hypothetical protein [Bacteroides sp.]MDD3037196.1 hypothetical protein [Bacteroides sp.]